MQLLNSVINDGDGHSNQPHLATLKAAGIKTISMLPVSTASLSYALEAHNHMHAREPGANPATGPNLPETSCRETRTRPHPLVLAVLQHHLPCVQPLGPKQGDVDTCVCACATDVTCVHLQAKQTLLSPQGLSILRPCQMSWCFPQQMWACSHTPACSRAVPSNDGQCLAWDAE
jgi:hypothetical protein